MYHLYSGLVGAYFSTRAFPAQTAVAADLRHQARKICKASAESTISRSGHSVAAVERAAVAWATVSADVLHTTSSSPGEGSGSLHEARAHGCTKIAPKIMTGTLGRESCSEPTSAIAAETGRGVRENLQVLSIEHGARHLPTPAV
jgi:hypothetical protein